MDTDYSSMYLSDLKLLAKGRRIKMYYVKTKDELVALLSMKELPEAMKIEKMTIHQLRAEAKKRNIAGFWSLRRGALVDLLFPKSEDINKAATDKDQQNESQADEHHQPEEHDPEEVGIKNA